MHEPDLPKSPIFDSLDPEQRRTLLALTEAESYPSGATILTEGERSGALGVIVRGRCEVVKGVADGPGHLLAELGPGAVIGEMSFFAPGTHAASVRCLTAVDALKLTEARFAELERIAPSVAYRISRAIVQVLSDRLRRMDEWTGRLLAGAAPERREEWSEFRGKLYNNWDF